MSTPSTRKRANPQPGGNDMLNKDLPKRKGKALQPVSKPLHRTSLSTLLYWLAAITLLLSAFYAYRITQWKAEAGGWWNLATGKRLHTGATNAHHYPGAAPAPTANVKSNKLDLEDHINGIASILEINPTELASAISDVVAEHVAPKSLSSLSSSASAANAEKTAVDALFGGEGTSSETGSAGVVGSLGSVAKAVEAVVGFDEPVGADAL